MKPYRIFLGRYRLSGIATCLALGAVVIPQISLAQALGIDNSTDPTSAGYIYRASRMLSSGNPLGAIGQTAASSDDFEFLSPDQKAQWLAEKGSALFERGDVACIDVLGRLASDYPTSPKATQAILTIGDWYWYHQDWHEAIAQYSKVDISALGAEQFPLYSYRKALSYLRCGLPESAAPLIASIANVVGYERAAKYYTAYIRYLAKDYDAAYKMMKEVSSNKKDGIEPLYYMAQIEYLRGQYDDVINHAKSIMGDNPLDELLPELHRIVGLSYFKKGKNDMARQHLEEFVGAVEFPNDDALYALGAIQYADNDLTEAEKNLRQLTDRNNDLAQGAYLYLGQIAEQRGDMNAAAMAFNKAATMSFDQNVAETALYNHVVALTKGGNAPFASSITMLEDFLTRYPDSRYASDVQESLATAYFYEHNYERALASINKVRHPSDATLSTKQKILYKLGTSEITSGNLSQAAIHLREASDMKSADASLAYESSLWLGEALYGLGDYKKAASAYTSALRGQLTPDNRISAFYGLAYSQFKLKDWVKALKNFAEVAESSGVPASLKGDAMIREADCLLYLGSYNKAADLFQRASREQIGDTDYAAYRHAVVVGVTEGTDSKMKKLNAFLEDRPSSKWTPEVLLEAGNTMAALDKPDEAAPYFERLSKEFPKDNKSRSGALSLALAYMKQNETENAKSVYKEIIKKWPTSEEASIANDDMRRLVASDGSLKEYARFLEGIDGAPKIDPDEMDAITFEAAETAYAADQSNTSLLEKYIKDFPDGRYLANALMDLAESADGDGDDAKALIYLEHLLTMRGDSQQVPSALFLKADLLENAGDRNKAYSAFKDLESRGGVEFAPEAIAGVMRTTDVAVERAEYARRLLSIGGVSAEDAEDARFYEASGLLYCGQEKAGQEALKRLAANPNSLSGAKSAVELGEWYLKNGDIKNALSSLEAFTDAGSVHAYWLARGFILLADAYHAEGNDYLALEYLKSLRDNYPGEEADIWESIDKKTKQYSK